MYERWKQRWVRNAKANPELNLLRDMQDKKKGFHKYIYSIRKTRKNMIPLLNGAGELMTNDMGKDEVLNVSASVSKVSLVFRNTRHSRPDEQSET